MPGAMMPGFYNHNYQIVQTEDHVAILVEMIHDARIIPHRRRRAPRPRAGAVGSGDSRGYWDGDTLVIETGNFTDKNTTRGGVMIAGSRHLRTVERLTRGERHRYRLRDHRHRPDGVVGALDRLGADEREGDGRPDSTSTPATRGTTRCPISSPASAPRTRRRRPARSPLAGRGGRPPAARLRSAGPAASPGWTRPPARRGGTSATPGRTGPDCCAVCSRQPGLLEATAVRAGGGDVARLALAELAGGLRLHQVVDAGRAAADAAFGNVLHLQLGDGGQHLPRRRRYALRVLQVAGVVIRDPQRDRVARRPRLQLGEHLRDVLALRGEGRCPLGA